MFSCPVVVFIVSSDVLSWSLTGSWYVVALLVGIGDLSLPGYDPARVDRTTYSYGIFGRLPNGWGFEVVSTKPGCLVSSGWLKFS
jgi:hypothetical protein